MTDKVVFGRDGINNGTMASYKVKDGLRDLLGRESAMQVVEDMCGIMTVGEWFHDFCRKLRHDGWVEEGSEDLLCEVRDDYRAVGGKSIFRLKVRVIETFWEWR